MNQPTWIGRTLSGRYKSAALLGQGDMSAVYQAMDLPQAHASSPGAFTESRRSPNMSARTVKLVPCRCARWSPTPITLSSPVLGTVLICLGKQMSMVGLARI